MWKKEEGQSGGVGSEHERPVTPTKGTPAKIGPSIVIRGEVTGSEDLTIEGTVEGSVVLGEHRVGVGREGRVKADIVGKVITIEGNVEGNLTAQEQLVLRGSAKVQGDIKAPRVVLEDGATFRGLVDMGSRDGKSEPAPKTADTKSEKSTGTTSATSESTETKVNKPEGNRTGSGERRSKVASSATK